MITNDQFPSDLQRWDALCQMIADASRYLFSANIPSINPLCFDLPGDHIPEVHYSDDDTDYSPAAADFLHGLITFQASDERDYSALFTALNTCTNLRNFAPLTDANCIHETAYPCDGILHYFTPSSDDCPNMRD